MHCMALHTHRFIRQHILVDLGAKHNTYYNANNNVLTEYISVIVQYEIKL